MKGWDKWVRGMGGRVKKCKREIVCDEWGEREGEEWESVKGG